MKHILKVIASFLFLAAVWTQVCAASDIVIEDISFPGRMKPKTVIEKGVALNHFSTSASYEMRVSFDGRGDFNVTTYAIVNGRRIPLGGARVGCSRDGCAVSVSFHIFPSSAKFYGRCKFVCVLDVDNEIAETDESPLSNEWMFDAVIHPPGERF